MTEELEPDIRHVWHLRRGSDSTKGPRFTLDCEVHGLFVEPTRDEVRTALAQILDEALGPDPTEIAGWQSLEGGEMIVGTWTDTPVGADELEHLRRWKAEAIEILDMVEQCYDALPADAKAPLGHSKIQAVYDFIREHA